MGNSRVIQFIDLCLHPKVLIREGKPGQIYQARFSVLLPLIVITVSTWLYLIAVQPMDKLFASLFLVSSAVALLGFRLHARYELTAFLWMLGLMSLEILRVLTEASLSMPFFAWLPVGIGLTCYLSGPRLGALYTVIVLIETLVSIKYVSFAASQGAFINPLGSLRGLQGNLLLAEVIGGIAIYCFAVLREKAESELEQKRFMRAKAARKADVQNIVGTLAHELNNPIAIIDACLIRYRTELENGTLDDAGHARYQRAIHYAYVRIEKSAHDLKGYNDE